MKAMGICLGSSSIGQVIVETSGTNATNVLYNDNRVHNGNVTATLQEMLQQTAGHTMDRVAVTGRKFRSLLALSNISEAEAIETAYEFLTTKYPACDTIVSAGGEAFIAYKLDAGNKVANVITGNKCASGTGEFFLQQLKRMDLSIDEAIRQTDCSHPYQVAGRCSVFCKSDCTHALNKGESKGRIVSGLCRMMSGKITELLEKCHPANILLIGGAARNKVMVDMLRRELGDKTLSVADEAGYFEALGTALWAARHDTVPIAAWSDILNGARRNSSFTYLPAISNAAGKVTFKTLSRSTAQPDDECIIGLDVGSTTTKAVLLRASDQAILAAVYLRTSGDPVKASRQCYAALADQITVPVKIHGLGVTGSGRQIAGLHAQTQGVINEIIAHATAAIHFDPKVDTIFEIGGQDAKYTYIINRVPADYAMNEACSAGTGSFLEESARETMGIDTLQIADIALKSRRPPNFNDQCSAFIASDIKTAIQEGLSTADITAGLVYSICQNYANRVKGNRPVGQKIFMQGGVCYNKAVPLAMAAITGREIIVPPEPGLMGAFGVALEVQNKQALSLLDKQSFDLRELAGRDVFYDEPFICSGGQEQCDRKCKISRIRLNNKNYPFGGACNRYVNLRRNIKYDVEKLDLVALREKLVFEKYAPKTTGQTIGRIGLLPSLLVHSLYPLYHAFFTQLGYEVVLPDSADAGGLVKKGAAFCYPVELAHGYLANLLTKKPDFIFLPHIVGMPVENGIPTSVVCPLAQGEPYYLKASFPAMDPAKVLSPVLDFSQGYETMSKEFMTIAGALSVNRATAVSAYDQAVQQQKACLAEMREIGRRVLNDLAEDPARIAVILFGRPYNAFSRKANMGIPQKFASRGYLILPWEFLPIADQPPVNHMFWSMGQMMLKAGKLVKECPQLFAAYITNFSCGPDSFIISYLRNIMGQKPALVLELDSHTADAGLDTRIEAYLDVVNSYRELKQSPRHKAPPPFKQASTAWDRDRIRIIDSYGRQHSLDSPSVQLIVPSMGRIATRLFAGSLKYAGYQASFLAPSTATELAAGRANTSCKECLPYILVAGSILEDIARRRKSGNPDDMLVYFVADSSGPCRLGQYHVGLQQLIEKNRIPNVVILTLSSDNGYMGLGSRFFLRAWQSILIADVLSDIYSALLVLAQEKDAAIQLFDKIVGQIEHSIAQDPWNRLKEALVQAARQLAAIPLSGTLAQAPKVALLGEIFVRSDDFSRKYLVEELAEKGIITKVAPIAEFIYFCDLLLQKSYYHVKAGPVERLVSCVQSLFKRRYEKTVKQILAQSGLCSGALIQVRQLVDKVDHIISPKYTAGETTLTVATTLSDIIDEVSGVISIGPFGCMPNRVAEAILVERLNAEKPNITSHPGLVNAVMAQYPALPFLAVESDGNPFPPLVEAKLEIFMLQAQRLHNNIQNHLYTAIPTGACHS